MTSSPVPDQEILLEVNLNIQVRLTIILACRIFSRENRSGSPRLKYNHSSPPLSVISVQLNKETIFMLNDYLSFLTFYKGSYVSFENNFDSNHRIIYVVIPDLC